MPRPKKAVMEFTETGSPELTVVSSTESADKIVPLSIDYSSEALNDMARKINEIINHLNEGK